MNEMTKKLIASRPKRQTRLVYQNNISSSTGESDCLVRNLLLRTLKTLRDNLVNTPTPLACFRKAESISYCEQSGLFHECLGHVLQPFSAVLHVVIVVCLQVSWLNPTVHVFGHQHRSSPASHTWLIVSAVRTTRGTAGHGECPSGTVRNKNGRRRRDTS